MDTLDKFDKLAWDSRLTAVILGNPELSDFELVPIGTISGEAEAALGARNLGFLGVVGVVEGQFKSALAVPLDDATVSTLAQAFVQYVVAKLSAEGGEKWLENLWTLPDTREN